MLRTTTAFATLIALAAGSADAADLRMSWWGGDSRHTATQEALKICGAKYGHTIQPEFSGWSGFQEKFATQMAGGTEADILQINWPWLPLFSKQGDGFADLNQFADTIDLTPVERGRPCRRDHRRQAQRAQHLDHRPGDVLQQDPVRPRRPADPEDLGRPDRRRAGVPREARRRPLSVRGERPERALHRHAGGDADDRQGHDRPGDQRGRLDGRGADRCARVLPEARRRRRDPSGQDRRLRGQGRALREPALGEGRDRRHLRVGLDLRQVRRPARGGPGARRRRPLDRRGRQDPGRLPQAVDARSRSRATARTRRQRRRSSTAC